MTAPSTRHVAAALCGLALALPAPAAEDPHAACKAAAAAQKADAAHAGHGAPAETPVDHSAHAAQAAEAGKAPARAPSAANVTLEDLVLQDQDGTSRRFRSEVIGDRIVVVDFIFTTCTTICPVLSSKMARLQERLGDRLGKDVFLLSVSVDPVRDTPKKLADYARKWKARPGWSFLTGPKADVDAVLKGLGAYTPDFTDHPPMFLVGDGKAARWVRLNGFPDAEQLLKQVDELSAARGRTAALGVRP